MRTKNHCLEYNSKLKSRINAKIKRLKQLQENSYFFKERARCFTLDRIGQRIQLTLSIMKKKMTRVARNKTKKYIYKKKALFFSLISSLSSNPFYLFFSNPSLSFSSL